MGIYLFIYLLRCGFMGVLISVKSFELPDGQMFRPLGHIKTVCLVHSVILL